MGEPIAQRTYLTTDFPYFTRVGVSLEVPATFAGRVLHMYAHCVNTSLDSANTYGCWRP